MEGLDGESMEGGLSVEEDDVTVDHVPLHHVTNLQVTCYLPLVLRLRSEAVEWGGGVRCDEVKCCFRLI